MRPASLVTLFLAAVLTVGATALPPLDWRPGTAWAKSKKKKKRTPPATATSSPPRQPAPTTAQPVAAPPAATISLPVTQHVLANGLRVVLQPDATLPSVAVSLAVDMGPAWEGQNERGFSNAVLHHLKRPDAPPPNFPPLPSPVIITTRDAAYFTTVVAPSHLSLAVWREARRVTAPIRHAAFADIRSAVEATAASPELRADRLANQGCWAYHHEAIGSTRELATSDATSLNAFRRDVVSPQRMVLVVAGRFDPDGTLAAIERLFRVIPASPPRRTPSVSVPDQINQRVDLEQSSSSSDQYFVYAWAVPPAAHPDLAAVELAASMLSDRVNGGRRSRLRALPREARIELLLERRRGPSMLIMRVDLPATLDMDRTRKIVDDVMLDLARNGPTPEEMGEAWTTTQLRWLDSVASVAQRTRLLAESSLLVGDPAKPFAFGASLVSTNRDDVRRAVRVYLTPIRRNLVERRGPRVDPPAEAPAPRPTAPAPSPKGSKKRSKKKK